MKPKDVKLSRTLQEVEITLTNEVSGPAFVSRLVDLGHNFPSSVGNDLGVLVRRRPQKPVFACDIVRIHSRMTYTNLIEYNLFGDTKAPLRHSFPFISKLKSGDIITTGQYKNYQTFSNLQFRPLPKTSFHSFHIDFRDTSGEKIRFISVSISQLVFTIRKVSKSFLPKSTLQDGCFKTSRNSIL